MGTGVATVGKIRECCGVRPPVVRTPVSRSAAAGSFRRRIENNVGTCHGVHGSISIGHSTSSGAVGSNNYATASVSSLGPACSQRPFRNRVRTRRQIADSIRTSSADCCYGKSRDPVATGKIEYSIAINRGLGYFNRAGARWRGVSVGNRTSCRVAGGHCHARAGSGCLRPTCAKRTFGDRVSSGGQISDCIATSSSTGCNCKSKNSCTAREVEGTISVHCSFRDLDGTGSRRYGVSVGHRTRCRVAGSHCDTTTGISSLGPAAC